MDKTISCGLDYVLDCIGRSRRNSHWAYLTAEIKAELLARGFKIDQPDPSRMARISWPSLAKVR